MIMNSLLFKDYSRSIDVLCTEALQALEQRSENEIKELHEEYSAFLDEYNKEAKLSIAFIGQYNAGKSSTIAALTNGNFIEKHYETIDGERKLVEVYGVGDEKL